MAVTLLDYVDKKVYAKHDNNYQAVTRGSKLIELVVPGIIRSATEIKEELDLDYFNVSTNDLVRSLRNIKGEIIDACIRKIKNELPTLYFNDYQVTKAGYLMQPLDGKTFINYMRKLYEDAELITLDQWRYAIIDEMVPPRLDDGVWQNWDSRSAENIKDIDSAGIELYLRGSHFTSEELLNMVIKFSKFALGDRQNNITTLEGMDISLNDMVPGKAYSTPELKSIRYFNGEKHVLKIGFKTPEQRKLFKDTLFTPTWKLLNREGPEPNELKDACDICLFKGVSCLQCNGYDHWVGSCQYCQKCVSYPVKWSRDRECDMCKTGENDYFEPIISVQNVTGFMQEEGYYHHFWKARKYAKNPILKVHCFSERTMHKHYKSVKYPVQVCISCRSCITELQDGDINQICKSQKSEKKNDMCLYVYNCKRTLNTKNELYYSYKHKKILSTKTVFK